MPWAQWVLFVGSIGGIFIASYNAGQKPDTRQEVLTLIVRFVIVMLAGAFNHIIGWPS